MISRVSPLRAIHVDYLSEGNRMACVEPYDDYSCLGFRAKGCGDCDFPHGIQPSITFQPFSYSRRHMASAALQPTGRPVFGSVFIDSWMSSETFATIGM